MAINSPYLPELNTPFGGIKQSGQGRELGAHGLYSYLEPQSVHIKYVPNLCSVESVCMANESTGSPRLRNCNFIGLFEPDFEQADFVVLRRRGQPAAQGHIVKKMSIKPP